MLTDHARRVESVTVRLRALPPAMGLQSLCYSCGHGGEWRTVTVDFQGDFVLIKVEPKGDQGKSRVIAYPSEVIECVDVIL